jgi:selenocysteine lyase/cysteine desulfurase
VDGAQAVGMIPVNLAALGCDSYAFSGHKWLGGPHETGVFFIRHDRLEAVALTGIGSHSGDLPLLPGVIKLEDAAWRHEYGTRNLGLIAGLVEAVRLQELIGRERIAAHGRELATLLLTELGRIDGIEILTPRADEMRASMTTIRHARAGANKFFEFLKKKHGLRCRPVSEQRLEAVRISTHVVNSRSECERVIAAVHAAAREL